MGSSAGLVAQQQSKACARRFSNKPGERGAVQTGPGEEGRRRGTVAGDDTLYKHNGSVERAMGDKGKPTKKKGPGTRRVNTVL